MTDKEIAAQNNGLIIGAVMAGHFYAPKAFKYFDAVKTKDALTGYVRGVFIKPDISVIYPHALSDGSVEGVHITPDVRIVDAEEA